MSSLNKVSYIEPNYTGDLSSDAGERYLPTPNRLEDYCIFVSLEVETRGRMVSAASQAGKNTYIMQWISDTKEGTRVNFLSGKQIKVSNGKFINSLTTNYTTYLHDIKEGCDSNEMFGISSIDISYNDMMVPVVTIKFVDVRGAALFSLEEARHNQAYANMTGFSDKDVAGSFFNCFFTFPYPRFHLCVKGFYGKPASYELTCADFKASFDSQTGNFNVTATFNGYYYSFLNDISANMILAAPYSDRGGQDYWESRVEDIEDDFFLIGTKGDRKPMVTFGDFMVSLAGIQMKINAITSGDEAHTEQSNLMDQKAAIENMANLRASYLNELKLSFDKKWTAISHTMIDAGRYIACIYGRAYCDKHPSDFDQSLYPDAVNAYNNFKGAVESLGIGVEFEEFGKSIVQCCLIKGTVNDNSQIEYKPSQTVKDLPDNLLFEKISEFISSDATAQETDKILTRDSNCNYEYWGFYQELGKDLTTKVEEKNVELTNKINENAAAVIQSESNAMGEILGFAPTIYNIVKIVFAHIECFIYLLYDLASQIYDESSKEGRTLEALGLVDVITDVKSGTFVPPFPKVCRKNILAAQTVADDNMDGTDITNNRQVVTTGGEVVREEEEWVGNISKNFLEESFVCGILNGAKEMGMKIKDMQLLLASLSADSQVQTTERKLAVKVPVSPIDIISSRNPWGSLKHTGKNFDDTAFVGKCFLRMYSVLGINAYSYNSELIKTIGKADGVNFADQFPNPPKAFVDRIETMDFNEYFCGILRATNENYTDLTFAWEPSGSYGLGLVGNSNLRFNMYGMDGNRFIPTGGQTFTQVNRDLNVDIEGKARKLPTSFDNYIVAKENGLPDNVTNRNVFFVDYEWSAYLPTIAHLTFDVGSDTTELTKITEEVFKGAIPDEEMTSYRQFIDEDKLDFYTDDLKIDSFENLATLDKMKVVKMPGLSPSMTIRENSTLFGSVVYRKLPTSNVKLRAFMYIYAWSYVIGKDSTKFVDSISSTENHFLFAPALSGLHIGACLWAAENYNVLSENGIEKDFREIPEFSKLRPETKKSLINMFTNWSSSEFLKIMETFGIEDKLAEGANLGVYEAVAKVPSTEEYVTKFKSDADTKMLLSSLLTPVMYIHAAQYDANKTITDFIRPDDAKVYWDAFREQLGISYQNIKNSDTSTGNTNDCDSPDDMKIAVYHYAKTLYDKWIAGGSLVDDFENVWKLGTIFDPSDQKNSRFHFIDSFYNDASNRILINPEIVVNDIVNGINQENYSILSLLNDIFRGNRFMLLCIQNFFDLSDGESMRDMFKPYPIEDIEMPDERPTFVAFYTYEPSKNLDMERSEYKNDGFMLDGNEDMWPIAIRTKDISKDYTLPAFGVTYGIQSQSYFTDIDLDMGKHQNTEESLRVQYMLAGAHTDTSMAKQYVTWGQDMFTLYSNTSYVASVNMMGCAWVQPMMYFCLTNIPMFRGSYLIQKVTHSIQPGDMKTTFNGVRMANIASRLSKDWIAKAYFDYNFGMGSTGGAGYDNTIFASVMNDCQYKIFPLFGGDYSVAVGANEEEKLRIGAKFFRDQMGLDLVHAAALGANIWAESGWKPDAVNPSSKAEGLCQWLGDYKNKWWTSFWESHSPGKPKPSISSTDMETQLWYVKYYLEQTHEKDSFEKFKSYGNTEDAAEYFRNYIERPDKYDKATKSYIRTAKSYENINERRAKAKAYLSILQNGSTSSAQPSQQSTSSSGAKKEDYTTALAGAIQKTVSHSKDLGQIEVDIKKDKNVILIKSSDNTTLASVFDMCLNGYNNYIQTLSWAANSSNQLAAVSIGVTENTQTTGVWYTVGDKEATDWEHLDTNFYKSLYKKYGNVGSDKQAFGRLQKEVKPFANCTDSNAAGNLLGGSGVQPCPSPISPSGDAQFGSFTPGAGYFNTNGLSIEDIQIKLFGRKLSRTKSGDPESWVNQFIDKNFRLRFKGKEIDVKGCHKSLTANIQAAFDDLAKIPGFELKYTYMYSYRNAKNPNGTYKDRLSNHSYGTAIDINPSINPYTGNRAPQTGDTSDPNRWRSYNHPVVQAMKRHGFGWGGSYGDYMHFSIFDGR